MLAKRFLLKIKGVPSIEKVQKNLKRREKRTSLWFSCTFAGIKISTQRGFRSHVLLLLRPHHQAWECRQPLVKWHIICRYELK